VSPAVSSRRPVSRRERVNWRARMRLQEAPSSECPSCGRLTKTVDGVCADCWGVKTQAGRRRAIPAAGSTRSVELVLGALALFPVVGLVAYLLLR